MKFLFFPLLSEKLLKQFSLDPKMFSWWQFVFDHMYGHYWTSVGRALPPPLLSRSLILRSEPQTDFVRYRCFACRYAMRKLKCVLRQRNLTEPNTSSKCINCHIPYLQETSEAIQKRTLTCILHKSYGRNNTTRRSLLIKIKARDKRNQAATDKINSKTLRTHIRRSTSMAQTVFTPLTHRIWLPWVR